jgi:hypothetical protein
MLGINLVILVVALVLSAYFSYFYIKPEAASLELYEYKKQQLKAEKQMDSFAMALDDFEKKTKESNGKAVMAMLNLPVALNDGFSEDDKKRLIALEYDIKQQYLIYMFASVGLSLIALINLMLIRRNNKG